ncbi:MAG: MiaB/RimO family radical SAM methylthiotransferase [Planctomycetota bacterium]|nr:MiaB/RimO family radical SAM methylthiotransferase [Planctomycetota bacterium]
MRFSITTLGCKVNQYDGCALAAALRRAGLRPAQADTPAELLVINTCCVTSLAMRKSRQAVRRAVRSSPDAVVLVTGCYSDYDAQRIASLLAAMNVTPNKALIAGHHSDLTECVRQLRRALNNVGGFGAGTSRRPTPQAGFGGNDVFMNANRSACYDAVSPKNIKSRRAAAVKNNVAGTSGLGPIDRFDGHRRAFVKVQDGCDAFCAYCIVPYTRPRFWSRDPSEIEAECRALVSAGHREIVLSGVCLGAFGQASANRRRRDDRNPHLPELVRRIAEIAGLWRLRLSSLMPGDMTDELLATCRQRPNVAPHFHLPLQSGSSNILRRMNRPYTAGQFRRTIDRIREAFDRPAVTTDIIVGFPGESDADFAATIELTRYAGFAKIHTFPFSAIEGTAAWRYRREAPPTDVVKARIAELAEVERELAGNYRRQFVGEVVQALVERADGKGNGTREAMTDRYLRVRFGTPAKQAEQLTGSVVRLHIEQEYLDGLKGTLADTRRQRTENRKEVV